MARHMLRFSTGACCWLDRRPFCAQRHCTLRLPNHVRWYCRWPVRPRSTPRNVSVTPVLFNGRDCVEVRLSGDYPGPDRDYFAYVPGLDMRDGTIEVELAGAPLPRAPGGARGFAGLAFRIDEAGGSFACESASRCPAAVPNSL
jgi:hypothetical protein